LGRECAFLLLVIGSVISAHAKDAPTNAIVLFDGAQGAAYVQVTEVTLNGKTEVRVCDGVSKFDKNAYNMLPRTTFKGASSLQRGADGALTLTLKDKPLCVVPSNLKFDKKPELTPAEAAEQAVIQGALVSSTALDPGIPALKPKVQLVFVSAPDFELAHFLRAKRADTVKDWQDFLARYPTSKHLADARSAIAGIHQQAAEAAFEQYKKSNGGSNQNIAMLAQASRAAQAANQASPGYNKAVELMATISQALDRLLEPERAHLQAFQKALQDHGAGYSRLAAAKVHVDQLVEVRSDYAPLLELRHQIDIEERKLESTVASAESLIAAARYDEAVISLGAYSSFAAEIPRVDAVVTAAFQYHFERGQRLAVQQDWEHSVAEFSKAATLRPESKEADAALNNAKLQLSAQRDQETAKLALLQSNDYVSKHQFIEAYNVLADLPDSQRKLVSSQLSALTSNYVSAATRRAQKIQEAHMPIRGRADEDAIRAAYVLLDRASSLMDDPAITLKRDFLSSKISAYYADQARRYLDKPLGTGAGVGWLYLTQAKRYGITNLDNLKDEMTRYTSLYQRRARLSVGIMLSDQTSRRDSSGFADQLADAISNGLESSAVLVEVVHKPTEVTEDMQPNFTLVGEILDDRVIKNVSLEAPQSKYRAGTHETRNPAWLEAKIDYESAQQQLAAEHLALADARSQHKAKDTVNAANDAVQNAQKRLDESRHKLETTDQKRVEAIAESYHYTKKTIDVSGSIQLVFRVNDQSGQTIGQPVTVSKTNHKTAVVLQNVKPEDTEGITNQSVEPDEVQFLTDVEIEARDALVKAVREKAAGLPAKILQEARNRAHRDDMDAAGEEYVLYLNATPAASSPEREEAVKFLRDQFNLTLVATAKL